MRLIDAEALLNSGYPTIYHTEFGDEVINTEDIKNAPTVRPSILLKDISDEDIENFKLIWQRATSKGILLNPERPHGKWIDYNAYYKTCPFCKRTVGIDFLIQSYENPPKIYNFCPNCGADMRDTK